MKIALSSVTKAFGRHRVLDAVNFESNLTTHWRSSVPLAAENPRFCVCLQAWIFPTAAHFLSMGPSYPKTRRPSPIPSEGGYCFSGLQSLSASERFGKSASSSHKGSSSRSALCAGACPCRPAPIPIAGPYPQAAGFAQRWATSESSHRARFGDGTRLPAPR